MPFANNQGIRIYFETEGEGPPVILQYGQYFPLDIWDEQGLCPGSLLNLKLALYSLDKA